MQSGTRDAKVEKQGTQGDGASVFHSLILSSISHSKIFVYLIFKRRFFIRIYLLCILMSPFQNVCLTSVKYYIAILSLVKIKIPPLRDTHGGLVAKSCLTLATPWTVACQDPLSMGFSRKEY